MEDTFVEHLHENIKHFSIGLLKLVEQYHTIRLLLEHDRQRPWCAVHRAEHTRESIISLILGHIEASHRTFIAEIYRRKRFRSFSLSHTSWSEEKEITDRSVHTAHTCTRTAHRIRQDFHRLLLTNDQLLHDHLEVHEFLAFFFTNVADRNICLCADEVEHIKLLHQMSAL